MNHTQKISWELQPQTTTKHPSFAKSASAPDSVWINRTETHHLCSGDDLLARSIDPFSKGPVFKTRIDQIQSISREFDTLWNSRKKESQGVVTSIQWAVLALHTNQYLIKIVSVFAYQLPTINSLSHRCHIYWTIWAFLAVAALNLKMNNKDAQNIRCVIQFSRI